MGLFFLENGTVPASATAHSHVLTANSASKLITEIEIKVYQKSKQSLLLLFYPFFAKISEMMTSSTLGLWSKYSFIHLFWCDGCHSTNNCSRKEISF
jgi:hypothetical protein